MGNISLSDGTKAILAEVETSSEGWHFTLDFSRFLKENYELNKEWGITEEDLANPRLIIWDMNKYPNDIPFAFLGKDS